MRKLAKVRGDPLLCSGIISGLGFRHRSGLRKGLGPTAVPVRGHPGTYLAGIQWLEALDACPL